MNKRTARGLMPIFVTLLILFEFAAYLSTIAPPQGQFFQFYATGSNETAYNYYPDNSSFLQEGENVEWNLGIINNFSSLQYVSVRVKLGNQTINSPNDSLEAPSPSPLIAEFDRFLPEGGIWQIPFVWQITNYTIAADGLVTVRTITINNETYPIQGAPTCQSINSCRLRMIFELWAWNINTAEFEFGWMADGQRRDAWLQLWFNIVPGVSSR